MELKPRSFRVTDETVDRIKLASEQTGRPMHRILAAAVSFFDPAENIEHMRYLLQYESETTAGQLASKISDLLPGERDKLLEMLSKPKSS